VRTIFSLVACAVSQLFFIQRYIMVFKWKDAFFVVKRMYIIRDQNLLSKQSNIHIFGQHMEQIPKIFHINRRKKLPINAIIKKLD
jgi:hypothetical protein